MKNSITKSDIIHWIKREKPFLNKKYGVLKIGLFGSYAKDKQDAESDIDILVELKEPSFEYLAGLQVYMEKKIGKKIEIIRKRKSNSQFLKLAEKDIIYV